MAFGDFFKKKEGGEEEKKEDEEPKGPPAAGYRGMWGDNGMMALFWAMITFPLGFVGLLLLSPSFIFILLLSIVLFVTGVVLIEMEQREPEVSYDVIKTIPSYHISPHRLVSSLSPSYQNHTISHTPSILSLTLIKPSHAPSLLRPGIPVLPGEV